MAEIGVADAIEKLRVELLRAFQQGEGQDVQFAITDVDLELSLVVEKEGEGKLGIKWLVVDAGLKGKLSAETTHRVTLKLLPMRRDTNGRLVRLLVSDHTSVEFD
jgi:hypothetical protein